MTEIKIKDIGPIVEFEYELRDYGLHVLEGPNGGGKSTTQRAVELITNGRTDAKLTKREGTPRGEARVGNKSLRIMKQTRTEGELDLSGLGDLSIMDLHSPKYDKPETRDRHRIRTLTRLAGVEANASLFHSLLGGKEQFESLVPVDALKTDDLVEMAARVKRAIEREALRVEEREQTALADARAQQALYEATDTSVPSDETALQAALETAIKAHQDVASRRTVAAKANAAAEAARATLAGLGDGLTLADAEAAVELARTLLEDRRGVAQSLDAELVRVQADARLATGAEAAAKEKAAEARSAAEQVHSDLTDSSDRIRDLARQIAELQAALQLAQTEQARLASLATTARERATLAAEDLAEKEQASLECMRQQAEALAAVKLAKSEQTAAESALTGAQSAVEQAKREGTLRAELQAAIAAGGTKGPSEDDFAAATSQVETAKAALTEGFQARQALEAKAKADGFSSAAKKLGEQARRLRDSAADTATVLTESISKINGCPLRVKMTDDGEPILVMNDEKSESFDRRSGGQRWVTVMQVAADANRLIVLPEEGYSSLQPSARALLHRLAQEHKCFILGAKAADCELSAHLYDPEADKDKAAENVEAAQ